MPGHVQRILDNCDQLYALAEELQDAKSVLFLGRHAGFPIALEGALKLKELAYIHAEGFAAGELKHGPIALIEPGLPVFCVVPPQGRDQLHDKMVSAIQEIRARGARTIVLAEEDDPDIEEFADTLIRLPRVSTLLQPVAGRRTPAAVRLRAGDPSRPRRRPAAQPRQVRHGRVDSAVAIVGVGIDVVDIARFEDALRRTPGLAARLFTPGEIDKPPASLAARFAAKEALAKALGAPGDLAWHDAEVVSDPSGRPLFDDLRHRGRPLRRARRGPRPPLALPRRRHRLGGRGARVMRAAHTVEQVRAAEADLMATLPDGTLMQRAATGLATVVIDLLGGAYGRRVLLLVGSGDNGGDALYAGALLARRGAGVEAVLVSETSHQAGVDALRAAGGRVVELSAIHRPDVVVDGIVGIGGRPGLRQAAHDAVQAVVGVPLVAVDVPSGVDVDTGRIDGTHVTADVTVTFGTHKVCHLVEPAASACGVVQLVDIGLDLPEAAVSALQPDDVAALLPRPRPFAQKYTRGVVGVRAGSARYPGAGVLLDVRGGLRARRHGALRRRRRADPVRARHPEVVVGEGRVQAWVVGSGGDAEAAEALAAALGDGVPLVVDADALQHLEAPPRPPGAAHAARRRARRDARRRAGRGRGRPAGVRPPGRPRRTPPWCCSRVTTRSSPRPTAGSGSPPRAPRGSPSPAPATCSADSVGALLAAGLDAVRRRRRSARGCTAPPPPSPPPVARSSAPDVAAALPEGASPALL